ncbi:thiol-disulfide oxidoreductase DCC family protein [Dokdonia sp. Hel_I_53]|uniref:thiol-disulfide oxidoreductase DCC family protein n=1 Tax=Dokdonia sp. Hel_I_53 TaxID=1566287 RepID=UPI00119B653A|nr:thiol-disulfide oxidoreductase DCC family protein [Dokdonia sp. Hel_I_53]TVZ51710.1 putative DCC family thiol-disulfide oxidoreductase YuxK [Dokdonia sp. Hel_I_53]
MNKIDISAHKIILFDGVCNLCNGAITFVIQRDKADLFRYAPLQSDIGKELALKHEIDQDNVDSIILIANGSAFTKSTAALKIAKHLKGGWPLLSIFLIIPKFIRDGVYDFIARNRYRWFGKMNACMIPTPELKSKFLDYDNP